MKGVRFKGGGKDPGFSSGRGSDSQRGQAAGAQLDNLGVDIAGFPIPPRLPHTNSPLTLPLIDGASEKTGVPV